MAVSNSADMRAGYIFSGVLHGIVILMILLGLPDLFRHHAEEEQPIAVQLVNQADLTRALRRNKHPVEKARIDAPPTENPAPKPKPAPPKPLPQPIPPPSPEPPPEPPAPQAEAKPTPTPAPPPKPEPKPQVKPLPLPEPPKVEQKPPPKQVAKVPPKPPKPKHAQSDAALDQLLKNLSKQAATLQRPDQPPKPRKDEDEPADEASAAPDAPLGDRLTTAQIDTIRQQFEKCWKVPAGARDAQNLQVEVKVRMNPDATVNEAHIVDSQGRYERDPFWTAAADSALRAVRNPECSKLIVPLDKYTVWKDLDLFFDPKDML